MCDAGDATPDVVSGPVARPPQTFCRTFSRKQADGYTGGQKGLSPLGAWDAENIDRPLACQNRFVA